MKSLTSFTTKRKQDDKKTLVAYMTAGLPGWVDAIHALAENGADIIELGLPFSDPIMDGPVIAKASAIALEGGAKTLDLLGTISDEKFDVPLVVMTYTNVLYSHGVKQIIPVLQDANISGLILPDLTFEQCHLFSDALKDTDIALIQLIASTTNPERKKQILDAAQGFLYCVAIKGITGQNIDLNESYTSFINPIRQASEVPTFCGVGVRTPADATALSKISDGVIVGTSLVEKMIDNENGPQDVATLIQQIRQAID